VKSNRARDTFVYISEFGNPRIITVHSYRFKLFLCYVLLEPAENARGEYSVLFTKHLWLRTSEVLIFHVRNIKFIFYCQKVKYFERLS